MDHRVVYSKIRNERLRKAIQSLDPNGFSPLTTAELKTLGPSAKKSLTEMLAKLEKAG